MITFRGVDTRSIGWHCSKTSGLDDIPQLSADTISISGRDGAIAASRDRTAIPREGTVHLVTTEIPDASTLQSRWNALMALLSDGGYLTSPRRPNQRLGVRVLSAPVSYGTGAELIPKFHVELALRVQALSPWWEDATAQVVNFAASPQAVPVGTRSCYPTVLIEASGGTVTDPVITYRDHLDATVWTCTLDIEILSGDAVELDSATLRVRRRVSSVWSDALYAVPLGYVPLVLSPRHADPATPTWPDIAVSAGNGTLTYRRQWL